MPLFNRLSFKPALCLALSALLLSLHALLRTARRSPLSDLRLAAARASARAGAPGGSFVVVTAATFPYRHFVLNLACSLRRLGGRRLLLLAMDRRVHRFARLRGLDSVHVPLRAPAHLRALHAYGTAGFNAVARHKLQAVRALLAAGHAAVFSDADAFWCADAAAELARAAAAAAAAAPDAARAHLVVQRTHSLRWPVNSGLYFARAAPEVVAFFDAMLAHGAAAAGDDQDAMNRLLCHPQWGGEKLYRKTRFGVNSRAPYMCRWQGRVTAVFVPPARFPIGCTRFGDRHLVEHTPAFAAQKCAAGEFAVLHFSCWESREKQAAMEDRGMWLLDPRTGRCKDDAMSHQLAHIQR